MIVKSLLPNYSYSAHTKPTSTLPKIIKHSFAPNKHVAKKLSLASQLQKIWSHQHKLNK